MGASACTAESVRADSHEHKIAPCQIDVQEELALFPEYQFSRAAILYPYRVFKVRFEHDRDK